MRAGALVGAVAVLAGAAIQTRLGVALVDVVLTVAPGEARRAQAGEGVDAIHAGASIKAGATKKEENVHEIHPGQINYEFSCFI